MHRNGPGQDKGKLRVGADHLGIHPAALVIPLVTVALPRLALYKNTLAQLFVAQQFDLDHFFFQMHHPAQGAVNPVGAVLGEHHLRIDFKFELGR